MHDVIKPGIALFIVMCISAVLLGTVEFITAEPIRIQQELIKANSMREILPLATEFVEHGTREGAPNITAMYSALVYGEPAGYIFSVEGSGYSGRMVMLVGLNLEGHIEGISILEHSETPGLGANATHSSFTDQYIGLYNEISVVRMSPGYHEVQAITSSTITTDAVTIAVNEVLLYFRTNMR